MNIIFNNPEDDLVIKRGQNEYSVISDIAELQNTSINEVQVTVSNTVGVPSGSASISNGTLILSLVNIKGETGEQGIQGNDGPQGVSAVFDPETGNVLATLETTTGNSTFSAMTQKAVTDEIIRIDSGIDGWDETVETPVQITLTTGKYYNTNGATVDSVWNYSSSSTSGVASKAPAVTAGQKWLIYGSANGGATCQYVLMDSTKKVLYKKTGSVNSRTEPTVVNVEQDGIMVVNFANYNSETDKLIRVDTSSVHHDGLTEIAEDHENRIATLEGATAIGVQDNLTSSSSTDALSANQGRVLNEKIEGTLTVIETSASITTGKYYNTTNATVNSTWNYGTTTTLSGSACKLQTVSSGQVWRIYGKTAYSNASLQYVLMDSSSVVKGLGNYNVNSRTTPTEITIPEGVTKLIANFYEYNSETDKLVLVTESLVGGVDQDIEALDERIDVLEAQGKPLTGKTIVCFGDSLTQFYGDVQNKRWTDFFQEITGATVINVGIGGSRLCQRRYDSSIITNTEAEGYTNTMNIFSALDVVNMVRAACGMTFNANYTYLQLAQQFVQSTGDAGKVAAVGRLAEIDWATVDAVFIMAGANDWNGNSASGAGSHGTTGTKAATTTLGAVNVIIDSLLTTYPHLSIYWATEYPIYHGDTRSSEYYGDNCEVNGLTQKAQHAAIQNEVVLNHIPVCDLYNTLGWNQYNFSQYFRNNDSTHAYKGFRQIAERIAAFIISNKNF